MSKKLKKDLISVKKTNNDDGTVTWKTSNTGTPRSISQSSGLVHKLRPIVRPASDLMDGFFNCRSDYVVRGDR